MKLNSPLIAIGIGLGISWRKKGSRVEYGRGQISLESIQFTHSCPLPLGILSLIRYRQRLAHADAGAHARIHSSPDSNMLGLLCLGVLLGLGSDAHAADGSFAQKKNDGYVAGLATASVPSVTTSLLRLTSSFHTFYALLM